MATFGIILGILLCIWAVLGVLGNELQRRVQQVEAERATAEAHARAIEAAKALPGANLVASAATQTKKAA